ncbi:MAG: DNA polymerase IV [uncultured Propionibacteriaceae bacterium]|uniref:DNA polymerase IV n=1 Tax=uncultured Propionibacteriaceae bacterium TaxID=257457 RepID=A0A6J4NG42_9ACTN|nr:MAG: DNA polymerase IV [uncultured Propionibacteriaceae bacterium]
MHVDMDAFYASVALRSHPELRGTPVIVGGSHRGVVLSATYEARAAGVCSGMPSSRARRLCPAATFLSPNFDAYTEVSRAIVSVFESVTAVVESASIDEAYLDVTGSVRRLGSPASIGEHIRAVVADEQQITCSVGIGPTKFIAKVASRAAKPDGLCEVPPDRVVEFLHPLPVEAMWGIGQSTADKLHRLGLFTVGDLAQTPTDTLQRAFGPHAGRMLAALAWGRDARRVTASVRERSVGSQETFGADIDDPEVVKRELLRMSARTASRLRKAQLLGRTVAISVRFANFTTVTRSATVSSPTDVTDEIYQQAVALYDKLGAHRARVRRVGVRVESLVPAERAYRQPELTAPERGWREAEQAVDLAVGKFGPAAVQRAALTRHRVTGSGEGREHRWEAEHITTRD